ncbi:MAG TPA: membrane protein insertase YidC [Xanthomonadales bacterium]|nr:membrane protein insertase YidC [Xanthomonadales bacterium]
MARLAIACLCLPVFAQADISVETSTLNLRFSDQGKLVEAVLCYPRCQHENARRQRLAAIDGVIDFGQMVDSRWVQRRGLPGDGSVLSGVEGQQLHFTNSDGQSVTWIIPLQGYRIEAHVTGSEQLSLRSGEHFRPRQAAGFGGWLEQVRYVAVVSGGVEQIGLDDTDNHLVNSDWAGFRSRFWTVLVHGQMESEIEFNTGRANQDAVLRRSNGQASEWFSFYLGPVDPRTLAAADEALDGLLYAGLWFWLRWICFALYILLGWINAVVPAWGIAIMALSLAVHVLMLPLSRLADRLQRQVNATENRLAPELSRIKRGYRGEEQAARIIALYKTERVHPLYSLKSMLGVAVVIPVFIGAFDMLAENIELLNSSFLWVRDLSRPDALMQLPFSLPFFGSELNMLPFLMTGLSFAASWLHQPPDLNAELRGRQVRNMMLLALAFFVLFYTFPAGMVLYWTSNNLISVGKNLWARR